MRWVVATPRPLYPRGKRPGTHCIGGGWVPGPVWTGAENLAHTGIQLLDRPARLRYTGPYNGGV